MARLAARLHRGWRACCRYHRAPPIRAREPALADDPWPGRGSRTGCRRNRGPHCEVAQRTPRAGGARPGSSWQLHGHDDDRSGAIALRLLPLAYDPWHHADGDPAVLLQRDLLHLRLDPSDVLPCCAVGYRLVYPALCDRKFLRPALARTLIRHAGPQG